MIGHVDKHPLDHEGIGPADHEGVFRTLAHLAAGVA